MKLRHWQIIWELVAHAVSLGLLTIFLVQPSFKWLGYLLIVEYITEAINSIAYYKWVRSIENETTK